MAAAVAAAAIAVAACKAQDSRQTFEFSGPTMGTTWSVKIVADRTRLADGESAAIDRQIRDNLARINTLMSTWDAESELSRFNRSTGTEPFPVSIETFEVFRRSVELAGLTAGAFDVTLAPVVRAWGFGGAAETSAAPDDAVLRRLLETTGSRQLELDPGERWVRKRRPEVQCDFSAIAPGYAADRIAAILESRGFSDFLVDIGGELVARGRNLKRERWQVAVERPLATGRAVERIIPLTDAAIATSGDYRNYRELNGERVAHILDPRTGHPIRHALASVTVLDQLCVRADALATALMVLGPDEGMTLARRLDVAVLMLTRNAAGGVDEQMSPRFEELMRTP